MWHTAQLYLFWCFDLVLRWRARCIVGAFVTRYYSNVETLMNRDTSSRFSQRFRKLLYREMRRVSCSIDLEKMEWNANAFLQWWNAILVFRPHGIRLDKNDGIRKYAMRGEKYVLDLRSWGFAVPGDILDCYVENAICDGNLKILRSLTGAIPSRENLLRCMEAAKIRNVKAALECAQLLKDYNTIAEILSVAGTPNEMLIGQLYLKNVLSDQHLS